MLMIVHDYKCFFLYIHIVTCISIIDAYFLILPPPPKTKVVCKGGV